MKILLKILLIEIILAGFYFYHYFPKNNNSVKAPGNNNTIVVKPESKSTVPEEKPTTFVFAGDMMLDRYVYHSFKTKGFDHIFDNLDKSIFSNKDISAANLEGPVSDKAIADDYPERSLIFNMPPETITTIKNLGLNGVSLANNHTLNAGAAGFLTTKNLLSKAGIKFAGSQDSFDETSTMRFETEIPVSIIAVDLLSYRNTVKISEAIKKEKADGNFVIIFPHWGEEYALTHNATQENFAKSFIDAGAGLIIGSHPHVVQDVQIINNVPVIYSMGNFVFDQTFSADTQQGLVVQGSITKDNLELTFVPIESKKLTPEVANNTLRDQILNRILPSDISGKTEINSIEIKRASVLP